MTASDVAVRLVITVIALLGANVLYQAVASQNYEEAVTRTLLQWFALGAAWFSLVSASGKST